jgi:hypothetical protein
MFTFFKKRKKHPGNDKVRHVLAQHGDDGTKVRHVIHFAYPADASRAAGMATAKETVLQHVEVNFTETDESEGIVFEHYREVASVEFDELTDALKAALAKDGWKYDGWECAVETG